MSTVKLYIRNLEVLPEYFLSVHLKLLVYKGPSCLSVASGWVFSILKAEENIPDSGVIYLSPYLAQPPLTLIRSVTKFNHVKWTLKMIPAHIMGPWLANGELLLDG